VVAKFLQVVACLTEYFESAYHRQTRGQLLGGAYITVITRSFGISSESDQLLSAHIASTTLGKSSLHSMRLMRKFQGVGLRFKDANNEIFVPVHLPAWDNIPVFVEEAPGVPAVQEHVSPPHQFEQQNVPPPEQPQHDPPQYPQHIYENLPVGVRTLAEHLDHRLQGLEQQGRRLERQGRQLDRQGRRSIQMFNAMRDYFRMRDVELSQSSEEDDD